MKKVCHCTGFNTDEGNGMGAGVVVAETIHKMLFGEDEIARNL